MTRTSRHRCLYCGKAGRPSKEHVLSAWLQEVLPQTAPASDHTIDFVVPDPVTGERVPTRGPGRFNRSGDPLTLTARTACAECNNTWMGQIVERAKPALRRLMLLDWSPVTEAEREALAAWSVLVTMNNEFGSPQLAAVPQADRDHIRRTGRPPPGWRVWIAKYRDLLPRKHHRAFHAVGPGETPTPQPNVQTCLFSVGLLLVQTASSSSVHVDLGDYDDPAGVIFAPFWPAGSDRVPDIAVGPEHTEGLLEVFAGALGQRPTS